MGSTVKLGDPPAVLAIARVVAHSGDPVLEGFLDRVTEVLGERVVEQPMEQPLVRLSLDDPSSDALRRRSLGEDGVIEVADHAPEPADRPESQGLDLRRVRVVLDERGRQHLPEALRHDVGIVDDDRAGLGILGGNFSCRRKPEFEEESLRLARSVPDGERVEEHFSCLEVQLRGQEPDRRLAVEGEPMLLAPSLGTAEVRLHRLRGRVRPANIGELTAAHEVVGDVEVLGRISLEGSDQERLRRSHQSPPFATTWAVRRCACSGTGRTSRRTSPAAPGRASRRP